MSEDSNDNSSKPWDALASAAASAAAAAAAAPSAAAASPASQRAATVASALEAFGLPSSAALEVTDLTGNGGVLKVLLRAGEGACPATGDSVRAHYCGKLFSAGFRQFDESRKRGADRPFVFNVGVGNVIRGWDLGFGKMRAGERAILVIAPSYGYGRSGAGGVIPPNATLLFDVELLSFAKPAPVDSLLGWAFTLAFVAVVAYALKGFFSGRANPHPRRDLAGQVVLITGANTGLGLETARELFFLNATVVISGRDQKRLDSAARTIEAARPANCVGRVAGARGELPTLDLTDFASVRAFAAAFLQRHERLDLLYLNAGVMLKPFALTRDGFEEHWQVNHLSHHLLTRLLTPALAAAGKAGGDARVIAVSSGAMMWGDLAPAAMADLSYAKRPYSLWGMGAYAQSKLANVVFASELSRVAKRTGLAGVRAFSLEPGAVHTELFRHLSWFPAAERSLSLVLQYFMKTPLEGAQTQLFLGTAPLRVLEKYNGRFFSNCALGDAMTWMNKQALNETIAQELWRVSDESVGFAAA
jgi:NAD(P)-dependent dehydrogenase (short-subunit alcohol dehydrogenase family)/FKBP-type peptidyl-prolyl cis-trans isomerase